MARCTPRRTAALCWGHKNRMTRGTHASLSNVEAHNEEYDSTTPTERGTPTDTRVRQHEEEADNNETNTGSNIETNPTGLQAQRSVIRRPRHDAFLSAAKHDLIRSNVGLNSAAQRSARLVPTAGMESAAASPNAWEIASRCGVRGGKVHRPERTR